MLTRQASFDFDAGKHGGKREHSGRPRGPRPKLWHRSRDEFPATYPCHVTLPVRRDIPALRKGKIVREVEAAFRRACSRPDFRLVHYSIQDDHAHLIVEADGVAALGRGMKRLAGLFAFAVNRAIGRGRTGKVLADRYHHEVLTCPRQVRNPIAYVLLNARRHAHKRIARLRKQGKRVKPLAPTRVLDARVFGALVRRLAGRSGSGSITAARARPGHDAGRGAAADVVPARGVAEASPDRSQRDPGGRARLRRRGPSAPPLRARSDPIHPKPSGSGSGPVPQKRSARERASREAPRRLRRPRSRERWRWDCIPSHHREV